MQPEFILNKYFGYSSFRSGQKEIIEAIINKANVLSVLPTGGGKSICYQIPALMGTSFSIVISPLIALMKDQVDSLNSVKSISAFINSTLEPIEVENVFRSIASGKIKLLYVAPEKLENINFAERIKGLRPSYVFIDEAHCISEWGHNFRPSYRNIKAFCDFIGVENISAFTATATPKVRDDIILQLGMKKAKIFIKGFERNNLHLNIEYSYNKKERCISILNQRETPAIIYTSTRKNAEEVCQFLKLKNFSVEYYHAGLSNEIRKFIQDEFINNNIKIIVATNAFGMGIDKSNIRLIIHYNLPSSIENYYQEIGRAGRDGKEAYTYLLHNIRDKEIQNFFIKNNYAEKKEVEQIYSSICDYGNIAVGSFYDKPIPLNNNFFKILYAKGINRTLVTSGLTTLAKANYIRLKEGLEKKYFFNFTLKKEQLKEYVKSIKSDSLKEIIVLLIYNYGNKAFNQKVNLDIKTLSSKINCNYTNLLEQLERLNQIGIINFDVPLDTQAVLLLGTRVETSSLLIDYSHVTQNIISAQNKLEALLKLCNTNACRFQFILKYFGENKNYTCGKCDNCSEVNELKKNEEDYLTEIIMETIQSNNGKFSFTEITKFLKGELFSNKNVTDLTYASLSNYNKEIILKAIAATINKGLTELRQNKLFSKSYENNQKEKRNSLSYQNNLELFNRLSFIRKEVAQKFNQSVNLICTDEILREICKSKPTGKLEILMINGFNEKKFNKIGEEFLLEIQKHIDKNNSEQKSINKKSPDKILTLNELVKKGYSIESIAGLLKMPEFLVAIQIESLIGYYPKTNIEKLFPKEEQILIEEKIKAGYTNLNQIRENLPKKISYAKIRIVKAKLLSEKTISN